MSHPFLSVRRSVWVLGIIFWKRNIIGLVGCFFHASLALCALVDKEQVCDRLDMIGRANCPPRPRSRGALNCKFLCSCFRLGSVVAIPHSVKFCLYVLAGPFVGTEALGRSSNLYRDVKT